MTWGDCLMKKRTPRFVNLVTLTLYSKVLIFPSGNYALVCCKWLNKLAYFYITILIERSRKIQKRYT
jgi:hypothetical protein